MLAGEVMPDDTPRESRITVEPGDLAELTMRVLGGSPAALALAMAFEYERALIEAETEGEG